MIRSFFKVKRKKFAGVSWVCETFVFQSEKKKILAGVSRVGRGRGTVTHSFFQRNISRGGGSQGGERKHQKFCAPSLSSRSARASLHASAKA